jgi:hypothetical protein
MTDTALATQSPPDDQKRLARRHKALEVIFGGRFVQTFPSPYMVMDDHVLRSPVAIRFYKKDFAYLSRQLYLEYAYRSWKGFNADLLQRYADVTSAKLGAIRVLMNNTVNRLTKLLEQQGHKADLTLWPAEHRCDVPIIAGQARQYIDMLSMLDGVYTLAGTANLLGVIDSTQRNEAEFICKKSVRAFRSILQTEVVKLYREAVRLQNEQQSAGQLDQKLTEIVAQQGQDIQAFHASSQEEENADESMRLGSADPGQLIDDAAASSSAAAAAAGGRKRPSKPKEPTVGGESQAPASSPVEAPAPAAAAVAG